MASRRVPRSKRGTPAEQAHAEALYDGVPAWMAASLEQWVRRMLTARDGIGQLVYDTGLLGRMERQLELPLKWINGAGSAMTELRSQILLDEDLFLDVVDFILGEENEVSPTSVDDLNVILDESGSAYSAQWVGKPAQLLARVPEPIQTAAHALMAGTADSSGHLRTAWIGVYGRSPDLDDAYDHCVKAIEAELCPPVLPADPKATLGKVVAHLKQAAAKWTLETASPALPGGIEALTTQLDQLWQGQEWRHGNNPPGTATKPTKPEAEAAIYLAVMVVQWVRSGFLRRV